MYEHEPRVTRSHFSTSKPISQPAAALTAVSAPLRKVSPLCVCLFYSLSLSLRRSHYTTAYFYDRACVCSSLSLSRSLADSYLDLMFLLSRQALHCSSSHYLPRCRHLRRPRFRGVSRFVTLPATPILCTASSLQPFSVFHYHFIDTSSRKRITELRGDKCV